MNPNSQHDAGTPEAEGQFHTYTTHQIPWFVRLIWVGFWVGAIYYVLKYAIPMAKTYFQ